MPYMSTTPKDIAAVYTRQSQGKERSIEEQRTECLAACEAEGWQVAEIYADTTSASRYARKERPDWGRLLADLEARRFGVLVMWESSRGDRKLASWVALLELCEQAGVRIHVVAHGRTYDMRRHRDWKTLADEGVNSTDESNKISDRVRRAMDSNAAKGRPHGVTLYGYERIYDEHRRTLKEQRPHAEHAPVVREVFTRIAAGEPLSHIVTDLNRCGIPSPRGAQWGRTTLRQLAVNPAYTGKRCSGTREQPAMVLYDAIWPPLVDQETWVAAQARLSRQATGKTIPGRLRWLLSYLATCGECGSALSVFGESYGCSSGRSCTYIRKDWLDGYVTELVIAWLQLHGRDALTPPSKEAEAVAARAEVTELRGRHDALAAQAAAGEISGAILAKAEASLLSMIKAAEERVLRAAVPPAFRALAADPAFAREVWEGTTLPAKRDVIRALMAISVRKPATRGRLAAFDPGRVAVVWRDWKAEAAQ